ncbi:MAG TPA: transcriptional regulator [Methanomassiliicoccaceae archaeon]|nr:transcriptional regulator [Methanomassiliicoccaceae archaeon]HPP45302.1 transcriptional regulator [Methanomassiliicoccaceae archaeon]HQA20692.1 transcriptional regulator [Methanomassiliicoccaceae archaeon]HQD88364.1 transcriptional regulator [Methanomassiliicoccaceae archaeon]
MQRDELIEAVRSVLARSGFYVSRPLNMRGISFDIVARLDDRLLIVKILSNVDALSKDNADEVITLAEALGASPLLIGERSGAGEIEESIVYSRFGIPIISLKTLADHLLEGVPPFIFAAPGGLYVKLDGEQLRRAREERSISLGTLAEIAGVSRRTIQMYESGMGAMIDVAIRLEEFLNVPIVTAVDPFSPPAPRGREKVSERVVRAEVDMFGQEVFRILQGLGFSIQPTVRCPFEALSRDERIVILTGLGKDESKLVEKATVVCDIASIAEKCSVIIIERSSSRTNIGGTAIVGRDELSKLTESSCLYELVSERSEDDKGKS